MTTQRWIFRTCGDILYMWWIFCACGEYSTYDIFRRVYVGTRIMWKKCNQYISKQWDKVNYHMRIITNKLTIIIIMNRIGTTGSSASYQMFNKLKFVCIYIYIHVLFCGRKTLWLMFTKIVIYTEVYKHSEFFRHVDFWVTCTLCAVVLVNCEREKLSCIIILILMKIIEPCLYNTIKQYNAG